MNDFSKKLLSAKEWPMLRQSYAETYPVRPLFNHIDELKATLRAVNATMREIIKRNQGGNMKDFDAIRHTVEVIDAALRSVPDAGTAKPTSEA